MKCTISVLFVFLVLNRLSHIESMCISVIIYVYEHTMYIIIIFILCFFFFSWFYTKYFCLKNCNYCIFNFLISIIITVNNLTIIILINESNFVIETITKLKIFH